MNATPLVGSTPVEVAADPPRALGAPCPCGRAHTLGECCLPLAQTLRHSTSGRPSPFDEIRAASALLLWSLLAREAPGGAVVGALSVAARRFWGPVLAAAAPDGGISAPTPGAPRLSGSACADSRPPADDDYGDRLFDRIWGPIDPETLTWLLGALPSFVRADPLLAELALDWLLWDLPWLRGRPGGFWTARGGSLAGKERLRRTYKAILRSRLGLWFLLDVVPGTGFRLIDRLSGRRVLLHTASPPWPEAPARLLLARVYRFERWCLVGGRCLLLDADAVDELLAALETRRRALGGPAPQDPRWGGWLKAELGPLVAAQWAGARLALPDPDGYHGAPC